MKFIALVATLVSTLANAQELQKVEMIPAIQKTAIVDGKRYYVTRDEKNKFVFIKHSNQQNNYAVKPIIVIPTISENNQK